MVWMLRDNSIHPLEFDHHLFLNNDSQKPAPKLMDDFTRAPDQRVGQLPVQQLLVLLILSILSIRCSLMQHTGLTGHVPTPETS